MARCFCFFVVTYLVFRIDYIRKIKKYNTNTYQSNGHLEVFRNRPSSEEHDSFISELSKRVALFLRTKYGKIDFDMPVEPQLMNFAWLKDRDVISQDEFDRLKSSLIGKSNSHNSVGFNK